MRDVVITGLGSINSVGMNLNETFERISAGHIGINKVSKFKSDSVYSKFDAEVNIEKVENLFSEREKKRLDDAALYALIAAREAINDSKLELNNIDKSRFDVIVGNGFGGINTVEDSLTRNKKISPFFIIKTLSNMISSTLAAEFRAQGRVYTLNTACASGTDAIGQAFINISEGSTDIALAGGTEASLNEKIFLGFEAIQALSKAIKRKRASIPFDADRSGFVMGEGAGMLVSEEKEHALLRGAHIYGEVVGYGATNDSYNPVLPEPNGKNAIKAVENAIMMGNVNKDDISFISAHGTSTEANDKTETKIIKAVFGNNSKDKLVSSLKGAVGHTLGASGAIESAISLFFLSKNIVPGTFGLIKKDSQCDLNYLPNKNIDKKVKYMLKQSFGFGGHNAVICLKVGDKLESRA